VKVTKVFIISDTHFPFHQPEALENIIESIKQERPTHVVQIGDLLDQYVFSKYTKSPEITPEMDVMAGVSWAQAMWKRIKAVAPKAKCYQLLGNHDMRLAKRISERLPELANVVDYMKFYKFSGVTTMKSDRDYLKIGGVIYRPC
jgi:UDP-2,3-diacylglucosamine pyrophosphatase LpxH